MQQKFDDFHHELMAGEERVTGLYGRADAMIEEGHFEAGKVGERRAELEKMWTDLLEVTSARREVSIVRAGIVAI